MTRYVKKLETELSTKQGFNRPRRESGDNGRVGPDMSWQERQEKDAHAEPVSGVTVYNCKAPLKTDTE